MSTDRAVELALKLMRLGVSRAGVAELLGQYPYELIERQLAFLPHRKAKRPEALIIDAIRNDYSPPNTYFYATPQTADSQSVALLDQNSELPDRPSDAHA